MILAWVTVAAADPGHSHRHLDGDPLHAEQVEDGLPVYETPLGRLSWEQARALCEASDLLVGRVVHFAPWVAPVLGIEGNAVIGGEVFTWVVLDVERSWRAKHPERVALLVKGNGEAHRTPAGPRPVLQQRYAIAFTPVAPVRQRTWPSHRYALTQAWAPSASLPSQSEADHALRTLCHPSE